MADVFSKNYRLYMTQTESYSKGFDPNDHTEPWELDAVRDVRRTRDRYEAVTEELPGIGSSLRYEYMPRTALSGRAKTVPLVIMLHGNDNDPRIQGESSGWVEAAAKHTIILTSIEWQGRTAQGIAFRRIGEAGTMTILDRLLAKYPQIDPGRVYFTGLSAGAMNSYIYGVNNLKRIAGVAGPSAPFGPPHCSTRPRQRRPAASICRCMPSRATGTCTSRCPSTRHHARSTTSFARSRWSTTLRSQTPDLAEPDVRSQAGWAGGSELAGRRAMIGTLSNRLGVMIKLVALTPYGHWNFKPAAEDMWAFLRGSAGIWRPVRFRSMTALTAAMNRFAVEWLVPAEPDRLTHVMLLEVNSRLTQKGEVLQGP